MKFLPIRIPLRKVFLLLGKSKKALTILNNKTLIELKVLSLITISKFKVFKKKIIIIIIIMILLRYLKDRKYKLVMFKLEFLDRRNSS